MSADLPEPSKEDLAAQLGRARPSAEAVLRSIRRGRVAYLHLGREEKRAFRDPSGQITLDVLRHLLGARMATERFPLTEQMFQAVALRLGNSVGQKRCRRLIGRLETTGIIEGAGHYRQRYRSSAIRSGFCVRLFRLALRISRSPSPSRTKHPVGNRSAVKAKSRPRWWRHPLFGDYEGRPPPEKRAMFKEMRSLDELHLGYAS